MPAPTDDTDGDPGALDRARTKVFEILSGLSGLSPGDFDADATFLELGFESLSLTQVSMQVKREFGVDLGFRDLLESHRTPGSLAERLAAEAPLPEPDGTVAPEPEDDGEDEDATMPDEAAGETNAGLADGAMRRRPVRAAGASSAGSGAEDGAAPAPDLERVIRSQIDTMRRQLELLRRARGRPDRSVSRASGSVADSAGDSADEASTDAAGESSSESSGDASGESSAHSSARSSGGRSGGHGPWSSGSSPAGELTERQREHVRELVRRVEERMPGSKRFAQEHRRHLSDPRTVEGFRRAWKEVVHPVVAERSDGAYLWDVDGNRYVDVAMGFGVALLGHHPPFVRRAIREQTDEGFAIGPQTPLAGEVAELIHEMTGMERVAFCNTGSEAVLAALRTARTVTGRQRIATFRGDYHGIFDEVLVRGVEVGGEQRTMPVAPGIPPRMVEGVTVLDYGDDRSLERIREEADELAAVLVEPVQSRHPDLQPADFVRRLREITEGRDVPLILDEMITGFRSHPGGIQALWDVRADLVTYGKVVGGGMPIGVVTGESRFLDALDGGHWRYGDDSRPEAGVTWFAGTFVRHPLSLAAARATLRHLRDRGPGLQEELNRRTERFVDELNRRFRRMGAPLHVERFSSLFLVRFEEASDAESLLYFHLRARGVHITDGRAAFLSTAHSEEDVAHVLEAFTDSVRALQDGGFLPGGAEGASVGPAPSDGSTARAEDGPASVPAAATGAGGIRELPLTEGQKEIWLATQVGDDANCAFNLSNAVRLRGALDPDALREAVRRLVRRHEALRTTLHPGFDRGDASRGARTSRGTAGDASDPVQPSDPVRASNPVRASGPVQRIHPASEVEVDVPVVDLADLEPRKRRERLDALRRREVETPFDLERPPLLRARLVRLREDEHLLLFTAHHVVCDGWSCGVLLRDVGRLYPAIRDGRAPDLPEATQLGEYVEREREAREGPEGPEAEEYWLERLDDGVPVVELPTDRPRPVSKTYEADRVELELGPERHGRLREAAAQRGATTFAFLYAVFESLLHRLSGQEELLVGVSAAGQAMVGRSELVGHCVSLLPVRNSVEPDADFADHLERTRTLLLDAFDHQRCTFGSLIEKLDLDRDPSRVPLVSVVFNLDPTLADLDFGGLEVSARSNPRSHEIFDLFFNVVVSDDEFRLECTFNTDLLDRETVAGWLEHYRSLLDEAVADPERPTDRLPMLPDHERRLLETWNDTEVRWDGPRLVHRMVERQADRTPDLPAVRADETARDLETVQALGGSAVRAAESDSVAAAGSGVTLSYRDLDERANRLAHRLLDLGIEPEDRVAVALDRSNEMVVALLGVLKAGAAYVPLDPNHPAERLRTVTEDAGVRAVVTREGLEEGLPAEPTRIRLDADRETLEALPADRPDVPIDDGSLAYVIYTSGSTGRPKGVMVEHRQIRNRLRWGADAFPVGPGDTVIQKTPFTFDVSVPEFLWTLSSGARLVMARPGGHREPRYLVDLIERERAAYIHFVPSMLELFLDEDGLEERCRSLRWVACSGEALPYPLTRRFYQLMPEGVELHNLYGPTEAAVEVSQWMVPPEPSDRTVPIGSPTANNRLHVLDRHRRPVPVGVAGELWIGGAQVARGYRNRPERTAEAFVQDPLRQEGRLYRTGDRARWRRDGTIEFLGRLDRQVKLRGFRIEPGEIESVVASLDGVRQAAVVVRDDVGEEPALVAYVVPEAGRTLVVEDVRTAVAERLPGYMVPSRFVGLDELPFTSSGKVDRGALPRPAGALISRRRASAPRTETQRTMAQLWSELLDVDAPGVEDDFFDLGGHSLLATRLLVRIRDRLDVELPLRTVFERPTLGGLAEAVDAAEAGPGRPAARAAATDGETDGGDAREGASGESEPGGGGSRRGAPRGRDSGEAGPRGRDPGGGDAAGRDPGALDDAHEAPAGPGDDAADPDVEEVTV